jgi:hypothetical protein
MKKLILSVFLFAAVSVFTFAEDVDLSIGSSLGVDLLKIENVDFSIIGIDVNMNMFQLWESSFVWDSSFGLFVNINVGFPLVAKVADTEISNDKVLTSDFIWGVGYSNEFSDAMDLKIGLGLHVPMTRILPSLIIGAGIGGIVGLNYKINDTFYLDFGSLWAVDFWAYDMNPSSTVKYFAFDVRPYIAIGFVRSR